MKRMYAIIIISIALLISAISIFSIKNEQTNHEPSQTATKTEDCLAFGLNKKQNEQLYLVGLGDSLTAGIGDEENDGGYFGKLEEAFKEKNCPTHSDNFSVKGATTEDLLRQLEKKEVMNAIREANLITITIGANDLVSVAKETKMKITKKAMQDAEEQYETNIIKTLQTIRQLNEDVHIYIIGFYNPLAHVFAVNEQVNSLISTWNEITKKHTATINDAYFVPIDDLFSQALDQFLAEDDFHPNHLGYQYITKRLLQYLDKGEI